MLHLLNIEIWGPMWPNLASSAVTFVGGYFWTHRKFAATLRKHEEMHSRRHQELREMIGSREDP